MLKRYFITGLLVVVPLYVTLYVLALIVRAMDNALNFLPALLRPQSYMPFYIPGIGIIFTLLGILVVGLLTQNFLGKKLVKYGEMILAKIPFLRIVYNASKQFLETFFTKEHEGFSQVVIFEYPRKGIFTMGFVTGKTRGELKVKTDRNTTSIFLPTTPNPTSGFFIMVPDEDVIPMDMSVEDAFKVIMTGGIIEPEGYIAKADPVAKTKGARKKKKS
ncbi:MAG: DUF502 domain-containing protein [Thermodesulfobacteriota bacterium]|nr:MAG: DUF502 domain-containing protein [Thermodesulfobacteriota bacterium]